MFQKDGQSNLKKIYIDIDFFLTFEVPRSTKGTNYNDEINGG